MCVLFSKIVGLLYSCNFFLTHEQQLIVMCVCDFSQHPINILLLSFWTLIEAFTIGVVAALYTDTGQGIMV